MKYGDFVDSVDALCLLPSITNLPAKRPTRLVLAIRHDADEEMEHWRNYRFKSGRTWLHLEHKCAGVRCARTWLTATVLTPKDQSIQELMDKIHRWFYGTNLGVLGVSLKSVLAYREMLQPRMDCNLSYPLLREAIYPIDVNPAALEALTSDKLPDDLDELIDWDEKPIRQLFGMASRWNLFILGKNSD